MRIEYDESIGVKIRKAIAVAKRLNKEIEQIVLTKEEWAEYMEMHGCSDIDEVIYNGVKLVQEEQN